MRRWLGWLSALLAIALATGGALAWRASETVPQDPGIREQVRGATETVHAPSVRVAKVERGTLSLRTEANGYLEPWAEVEVVAEVGGRVLERHVEEGSLVAADDLLIGLDDRDRRIELTTAEAEWLKVRAAYAVDFEDGTRPAAVSATAPELDALHQDLETARRQLAEGLIARQELQEIEQRVEAAQVLAGQHQSEVRAATSGLTQAEQEVERRRLALERTRIHAPFAGRVADLEVEVGQQVNAGEVLLRLQTDDRLKVSVDVLEKDIVHVRPGATARVRFPSLPGVELEGEVATVNPRIDPATGSGRVTVAFDKPAAFDHPTSTTTGQRLLPGLYASVEIETRRLEQRLSVPTEALLERQGRQLVFRVEDGRALWTYVETGVETSTSADHSTARRVEILDGLEAGQLVAVDGHFALAHEARVEVVADEGSSTR